MDKVISPDGTSIAYDRYGNGPGLILISGAFTDRSYYVPLATELASSFTVITYDRRGRGDSTDTTPYSVEREVEDLAALQEATGAVFASADSSGVMVLLRAMAAGVGFEKLSVMEPPFRVEGAPPAPDRYLERLQEFVAAGSPGGAAELFMVEAVGQPQELVDGFKNTPMWKSLEAMAPTLIYDALQMGDSAVPVDLLASIQVETLALHSTSSPDWLQRSVRETAAALPRAKLLGLPGEFHQVPPQVLAPALTDFFNR
ncbi:alpha/beta fold hydrolase [Kribbella monticola]|uniref:alpha/beta fold hydrolase n=1 Tax=Kribbella monticola TaxID=2185285 RepID=UPI000DD388E2|nr:alpha/beta hydrolase [Kribbella monticola]